MPHRENLALKEAIDKFFFAKHLDFLTSVPQRYDIWTFFSKGTWDEEKVARTQKRESFSAIAEVAKPRQTPIFISIDDSVIPKTELSSNTKRPAEGTGWHYSYLEGKLVNGYQVHAAMVSTGEASLCYCLKRYNKERGTKIEMTMDILESIPDDSGAHFLMDSWYTYGNILKACAQKGCFLIDIMHRIGSDIQI